MFIKYIRESVWVMETVIQLCPEVQNNNLLQNYDFPRKKRAGEYCILFLQNYVQIDLSKNPSCKYLDVTDFILVSFIYQILFQNECSPWRNHD